MKLINLDELVVLGPGSEWFWTMVSGVVLTITFIAIYRQLRLQRDAAAIEQVREISREWTQERMARAKLEVLSLIRDGADPAMTLSAGGDVGDFWEGLAYLARARSIDRRLIYNALGPAVRIWWGLLAPSAEHARQQANDRGIWIDFEWLAGVFAGYDEKASEPATYDDAYLTQRLPDLIDGNVTAVRRFDELRAVIVRSGSTSGLAPGAGRRRRREGQKGAQGIG